MDKFIDYDECVGKTIKDIYYDSSEEVCILFHDNTYTRFELSYPQYDESHSIQNNKLDTRYTNIIGEAHIRMGLVTREEIESMLAKEHKARQEELKKRELALLESLKAKYNQL